MKNNNSELYVVGIGASAGGLDAVQQLFDHTPDDTGMAFVIIQHLSPDFVSLMPELLSKHTKMKIFTAEDKQIIEPNCIYLNQRNKNLHIKGHHLYLLDKGPKHNLNLPIDIFFHTLGEEYKEKSIGVILSGTGSDGSRGLRSIKEGGGVVIIQDPISAQFDGMPNSAIATNQVDFILDPESIGNIFTKLPLNSTSLGISEPFSKSNETLISSILVEINKYSGIDFREYKKNTILRRLEKRMGINNIDQLYDYYTFFRSNEQEKEALKQDFLIGVTRFFRDEEAFEVIENIIVPAICNSKKPSETIRIWTAGCSSGEEVYSLAILFDNYIRNQKLNLDFKIFATDIDSNAIKIAGTGLFHINTMNEINKEYNEQYFIKTGDKIQIIKRIREKIVFSVHNIFKDAPFIKTDMISCRNLLIYLDNKVQVKTIQRLHFSLNKFGYLFLGNGESLGEISKLFKTIDTKWKIFQNISDKKILPSQANIDNKIDTINFKSPNRLRANKEYRFKDSPEGIYHKYISKRFGPDSIFIDKEFNILFITGDGGKRLTHNEGLFQNNLLKIVNQKIATAIRNGIRKLESEKKDIIVKDIVNKKNDVVYTFDITLHKPTNSDELSDIYILQFSKDTEIEEDALIIKDIPLDDIALQRHEYLENELSSTKAELQNVVEELETTNEELQSSNEELMASNEELQSTNEELQSVNEELFTVNSELQEKNKELLYVNDDVNNLLNSTDIGTLFLDLNLRIRKFTPSLKKHFNLNEADYGRPIASFASNFSENDKEKMLNDSKEVLEKLTLIERQVIDNKDDIYLIRIIPYITSNKTIDGVVITFVNINQLKKAQGKLIESETHLKKAQEMANVGSWYYNLKTDVVNWTAQLYKIYGLDPSLPVPPLSEQKKYFTKESWDLFSNSLEKALKKGVPYELELETVRNGKNQGWIWVKGEALKDENEEIYALWGAAQDITIKKDNLIQLKKAKEKAEESDHLKTAFLANMSHEIRTPMNGILGFTSLLRKPGLTGKDQQKFIEIIEKSGGRMLSTINDIIDIAKIEAGQMELSNSKFDICNEIENYYQFFKAEADNKGLKFILNKLIPDQEKFIISDIHKLGSIINNLIKNALKFTKEGSIEIGYVINDNILECYVKDTGIGIPLNRQEAIFNRFEQSDIADKDALEGSGLGLAISKVYAEMLGGNIWLESQENVGSTFHFSISFKEGVVDNNETANEEKVLTIKKGIKILIAEDDFISFQHLNILLKDSSREILNAKTGLETVELCKKHNDIDLILMDIKMPLLNGYESTKKIREFNKDVIIIAQTAYALEGDREKAIEAGCNDYITKPIDKSNLLSVISKYLKSS